MADWILHAHDTEDRSDTKEYSDLFQKLMSYAKDMGCEDLVDFDKQQKNYAESFLFEEESPAPESISMPKGHGFALTPYKGALVHFCYETLKNKFNFFK